MKSIREEMNEKIIKFITGALNFKDWNRWVEPMRTPLEEERIRQQGFKDNDIIAQKRNDEVVFTFKLKSKELIAEALDFTIKHKLVGTEADATNEYFNKYTIKATFEELRKCNGEYENDYIVKEKEK